MSTFKVILTKQGTWRGQPEEWSNGYHFNGTAPTDRTSAYAFFDALFTQESPFMTGQKLVRAYFYANPDGNVTIGRDFVQEGATLPTSTGNAYDAGTGNSLLNLEQAALLKWRCGYTSKGKPRYVMKYMHGARMLSGQPDKIGWNSASTLNGYLGGFTNGNLPGGAKLCRPDGTVCETGQYDIYVRTRTLKRRGKRPVPKG